MASERRGYVRYDSVQPRYNLLFRMIEDELVPFCRSQGLGVIVYSPFRNTTRWQYVVHPPVVVCERCPALAYRSHPAASRQGPG